MNQDTPGCGTTQTMGHGEGATCGQSFYGSPWYCSACTLKAAIAAAVAAERERCARLCESARFTGNTFPRTQMEQLRMDIAAAIRGIFAHQDDHAPIKEHAAKLARKRAKTVQERPANPHKT